MSAAYDGGFDLGFDVVPGPALLHGVRRGPSLEAHRDEYGGQPQVTREELLALVKAVALRGRGGAAFPFATKLEAAAGRHPVVVINLSEGEPASHKDSALAITRPHLVLDGALATARALRTRSVHVVTSDRPGVEDAMRAAVRERRARVAFHRAADRFVAGQSRAVIELMAGRPNLPVTSWQPEARSGHRGRPTLLSNAETWAQVGRLLHVGVEGYTRFGSPDEPGTALLSISAPGRRAAVAEVPYGTPLRAVLPDELTGRPVLVGGYHGTWATGWTAAKAVVSVPAMRELGLALGAGVVHVPGPRQCPVAVTAQIVDYLAGQSARRCGPCFNGLPAMARALRAVCDGAAPDVRRVEELAGLVAGRGACAHPDGTVRLVRSLLSVFPDEVDAHLRGDCGVLAPNPAERPAGRDDGDGEGGRRAEWAS